MYRTNLVQLHAVYRLYQYLSVVNSSSSAIRCMQTVSVSICRQQLQLSYTLFIDCISIYLSSTAPAPLYAVCRLYQYLSVVNSSSSATRCLQTVSVSICRQQLQLRYTLYVDCISIYLSSTAPAPLYAVCRLYQYLSVVISSILCRLYQYLSVVNSSSSAIRCMQTVSVSICRQQLQLSYTLYVDCISIYLSSTAPAQLHAVYRLYQYLSVVNSSSSATRCMQSASVWSCFIGPAPLHAVCRLHQFCRVTQAQLRYTLYVDCISFVVFHRPGSATRCIQTGSILSCYTGLAPLHAVCRLHQFCRVSQARLLYTLYVDCISIYLSCQTGPAPLHAVCRLYQHQFCRATQPQLGYTLYVDCISFVVLHRPSSAARCMQIASVWSCFIGPASLHAVCRLHQFCRVTQAQLRYTLYVDCISFVVFHRPGSSTRCMQTVSVSICRVSQAQLRYTLYVDCISIYLSCYTGPAPLHAVYRLYQYLSVVNSSSSATRCMQTVSVSISRVTQTQLRYRLFIDCISIYLSSTSPAPLYAVCRLYQYLSVVNNSSSALRCMQTVSVSICRQQLQLRYMLYEGCISIYLSSTTPAPLYAVCRLYQYLSVVNSSRSAIRCMQTVSVSICRQQLQLRYTLLIDCISIYLSSRAPAPLYAVYRLYQYLSVVNSSSSATCFLQTVSVSICRQQLQLLYTLFIDYISIYLSSSAPAPLYAVCRLYRYRQQLQLRYTLYVDCIRIHLSSTAPAPLYAVYRLYHYLSVVNSSC